jgi:hypothetical protein
VQDADISYLNQTTMSQENRPETEAIKRRIALKRLSQATLGTVTALVTATGSYQKPTLKKMMGLSMAAAGATSTENGTGGEVTPP